MWSAKIAQRVAEMSTIAASGYVRKMVDREIANSGSRDRAFDALSRRYGLTRSQIRHLRDGRAKTIEAGLFQRIRLAYLDFCERQIAALNHELALERAMGAEDDAMADFEREASELAAKVATAKAQSRQRQAHA